MERITLWKRLKKHYILVLASVLTLLLLIVFGVYRIIRSHGVTPIARIEPMDSVKTTSLPGKLERYKKELIEQEKEAYQRQIALEEIISMDFSQEVKANQPQKPNYRTKLIDPLENTQEKEKIVESDLPKTTSNKTPLQRKGRTKKTIAEEKKADDGFYIIKAGNSNLLLPEKKASGNTFVKALIHGNQKVKGGGTVCLRLLEEAMFNGRTYPENTILYGRISSGISGRVRITISQLKDSRVNLSVYDGDYMEGIAYQMREAVGEITRESRDEAFNEVLSSLPYGGVAGGLAELGRNVMRKAKRPNTIYLADGYQIFITPAK